MTEQTPSDDAPATFAPDGRMILDPKNIWFKTNAIVRACTRSTNNKMTEGYTCWSMASAEQKDEWLNIFRQQFYWKPCLGHVVRERYNEVCQKRLRDNMYKIATRKKDPDYMQDRIIILNASGAYETLMKHRESPEFKSRSKQAKINKRGGVESGPVEPTYCGGSQSNDERAMAKTCKEKGTLPTAAELFLETHTRTGQKGERIWLKSKDAAIYEKYKSELNKNPDKSENEIWYEVVNGFKKGSVYGVGNAHELLYTVPPPRSSQMRKQSFVSGIVSQLESKLDAHKAAMEARDEEIKKMKEQLELMQSYFAACNPGFRPPNPDPRYPFGGGGSGAGVGFPVG